MAGSTPSGIFISYRRQDASWPAEHLYQVLSDKFGADKVFKDVDSIGLGHDFVKVINSALESCDTMLALIGPQWVDMVDPNTGRRRLDNPKDLVRLEIATALQRDVRVVPVLVDGTSMPNEEQLPADLENLHFRHALEINAKNIDAPRLIAELYPRPAPWWQRIPRTVIGAAAGVVLVPLVVFLLTQQPWVGGGTGTGQTPSPSISSTSEPSPPTTPPTTPPPGGALAALAHRGGSEVHQRETKQAMVAAALAGYSVETDLRYTSDGVGVLVHDERAETKGLTCDRDIKVSQTTWAELQSACRSDPTAQDPRRYEVPRFADTMEAIDAANPKAWVFVEIKVDQTADQVADFLDQLRSTGVYQRTVVTSSSRDRLAAVRDQDADIRRLLLVSKWVEPAVLQADGLWGVAVNRVVPSLDSYIAALKDLGLRVVVWLVNDERQWAQARDAGADTVLTGKPAAYTAWLAKQ